MAFTTRPTLLGFGGAVSAGHYLATQAGAQMLADGGNAADAACTMGFALQVLEPHMNGPAGEVPILFHSARDARVYAISGQGTAPAAASIAAYRELGIDRIPGDGIAAATVPAALDAWCQLLGHFGTRTLAEVLAPARGFAERGFPMYPFLRAVLGFLEKRFREEWPGSAALYLPLRQVGERQTNPALAGVYAGLMEAEAKASGDREARIRAARDSFYKGGPAELIDAFVRNPVRDHSGRANAGLLTADDLARYEGRVEEPLSTDYRGAKVWKCSAWTQGPVFLQQLRLAAEFDVAAMGHGSTDAIHAWIECAKLAFADRDACYGDPEFTQVPLAELLSPEYARRRAALVDPARASLELRPGLGRLPEGWPLIEESYTLPSEPQALAHATARGRGDTTHLDAADREGNLVSATPSGAWVPSSPVIPELGFPIGTRAQMFSLDPEHPNALVPGKRPRTTLTPSMARMPDGRILAFGTPGGDQQDQWTLQFFQNLLDFGMHDLQEAIDAPTVHTLHMPDSFFPRTARPGLMAAEARVPDEVVAELEARGHRVHGSGPWEHGRVLAVSHDAKTGLFEAAASPRSVVAYAAVLG